MTVFVTSVAPPGWPECPVCGQPAALRISVVQAFCGNEDCRVLLWDPTAPDPLANASEVTLRTFGLPTDDQPGPQDSV